MTGSCVRSLITILLMLTTAGCGTSSTSPSQNPPFSLIGTWSGVVGAASGGGRALRVTWTASQTGSIVSGPATLLTSPAVSNITLSGTLTASIAGNELSLRYEGPSGSVPALAGCSVSGTGSATASGDTISGSLDVIFESCEELGLQPPTSDRLTLARQP